MIVRLGAAAGTLLLLAGCSWSGSDGHDRNPMNRPGYVVGESRAGDQHHLRGGSDATVFSLVNGVDVVRVRLAELGADTYDMSTPDGSRIAPTVAADDSAIVAGVRDSGEAGPALLDVVLDDSVRWKIQLAGGATEETVDLSSGPGGDVDFVAGTSRASVTLPAARGTQSVTLAGGASQLTVRLMGNSPARVRAGGGAGTVTIDGETHSGVAAGQVWSPAAWDTATDRYVIDATSGVSALTVTRA